MRKVLVVLVIVALLCVAYYAGSQRGRETSESLSPARAASERFQPGDTAVVLADRVELRDGERSLARLGKECRLSVQKVSGVWTGGTVEVGGKTIFGWVHERHLGLPKRDASPVVSVAAPAAQSADEAVKQRPAGILARGKSVDTPPAAQSESVPTTLETAAAALPTIESMYSAPSLGMRVAVAREPADLQDLQSLQGIGRLIVTGETFTNESLRQLEGWRIESLSIECPNVGNAGLLPVSTIKDLHALRLWTLGVSDAGLEFVATMNELETLDLEGTNVQGEGLTRLQDLTRLSRLTLGPKSTDDSLASLPGLVHLTELDLRSCHQLTEKSFESICEVGSLRSIWLPSRLLAEGVERLNRDLPDCVVRQ